MSTITYQRLDTTKFHMFLMKSFHSISILWPLLYNWTSLVAQTVKHLSTMWETRVRSLGWEDPLEKEMAIHSSTIAWKIPWTEEPGRLQSMGSQRVRHDWATSCSLYNQYSSVRNLMTLQKDFLLCHYRGHPNPNPNYGNPVIQPRDLMRVLALFCELHSENMKCINNGGCFNLEL